MRRGRAARSAVTTVLVSLLLVTATATVTYAATRQQPVTQTASARSDIRISLIGDSYSAGMNNNVVWPDLVADGTALAISNFAAPGSGYVGGTGESGSFADQLDRAIAAKPDVILVFGGINDVGKSKELIGQAATDLFGELARRAPESRIVVIGPLWHEMPPPEAAVLIDEAVYAAATAASVSYIRIVDANWLVGDGLIQADQIHPSDLGQQVIAREIGPLLQQRLRQIGMERTSS